MFKKLFKEKAVEEEEIFISPDEEVSGNTFELFKSFRDGFACSIAEMLDSDIDTDELNEEDSDYFANLGYVLYLSSHGFHASAEDVEQLEKEYEE